VIDLWKLKINNLIYSDAYNDTCHILSSQVIDIYIHMYVELLVENLILSIAGCIQIT
jgi:hypothetical protein